MFNKVLEDIYEIYLESNEIKDRRTKHNYIQNKVFKLAGKYGCFGKMEYKMKDVFYSRKGELRGGYIDVVWYYKDKIILAFEVDSSFRIKSQVKLIKCDSKYKIWLCYSGKEIKYKIPYDSRINYILPKLDARKIHYWKNSSTKY